MYYYIISEERYEDYTPIWLKSVNYYPRDEFTKMIRNAFPRKAKKQAKEDFKSGYSVNIIDVTDAFIKAYPDFTYVECQHNVNIGTGTSQKQAFFTEKSS